MHFIEKVEHEQNSKMHELVSEEKIIRATALTCLFPGLSGKHFNFQRHNIP